MNFERKIIWQHITPHYNRSLLQPLAVALVCAIFIGLFLTMGIIDLQRSERILRGFMEDQGMRIVGVVERLTDENMKTMILASQKAGGNALVPLTEQVISPQLFLTDKIVAMAREVDNHWKKEHLSAGYIRRYAEEKNLWYLAVLNAWGQVIYQSRELGNASPASGAQEKLKVDRPVTAAELFARLGTLNRSRKIGFIALSRKDGSGAIIIALDQNSARYWGKRVAVEKAIEKLGEGQGQGLVYLTVVDTRGMPLAYAGNPPEGWDREKRASDNDFSPPAGFESRNADYSGKRILELVTPLRLSGKPAGVIRLGLDRGNTDQIINENRRNMFVFLAFVVLIALLSMWLLYHNQNRHLAGILKMERQLEKAERLSALGQLAAGVAHEIRNPLNAISMASQRLKRECAPADEEKRKEFEGMASVIRDEIRRLNAIIEEFLAFAKSRRLELRDCPLQDVLQKILLLISAEAAAKEIELKTDWPETPVVIPMDVDKLRQAFLNFIKNAMESISGAGTLTLSIGPAEQGRVSVAISDTGCGMTTEEVEQIFNPEYTTKEKGLGLGLPLSHEIIRGHGGEIRVLSRKGSGTTFEILLPVERRSSNGKGAETK